MSTENNPTQEVVSTTKSIARSLLTVERILMGIVFVACGLGGLLNVLSQPSAQMSEAALAGGGVGTMMMKACWLFPMLKGTEVLLELYVSSFRKA